MTQRYIASLIALATLTAGAQQTLTKEIVVEREVEPGERAANRPANIAPTIIVPKMQMQRLQPGEYSGTGTLRRTMPLLEAAAYADSFAVSPYRGYASLGYLPAFNLDVSAGYNIIDKANQRLGAWFQYNGESYKMPAHYLRTAKPGDDKVTLKQHVFALGIDNSTIFRNSGTLTASASYMMGTASQPNISPDYDQTVTGADIRADWQSLTFGKWQWHAGLSVGTFGYDKKAPETILYSYYPQDAGPAAKAIKAAAETKFAGRIGLKRAWTNHSWGVDADLSFQHLNQRGEYWPSLQSVEENTFTPVTDFVCEGAGTYGIITLSPYYTLKRGNLNLRLGADIAIETGACSGTTLYPEVNVSFAPTGAFAVWGNVTGGTVHNTLSDIWQISPRQPSCLTYSPSKFADAVAGVTVGPFYGISIEGWLGYSEAEAWMTPAIVKDVDMFVQRKAKGVYYGASINWQLRKLIALNASVEGAPGEGYDKGYYRWYDNARNQFKVGITVRPIEKLTVALDWKMRTKRWAMELESSLIAEQIPLAFWTYKPLDLGDSNSFDISATYQITRVLTAFADIENIFASRWLVTPQIRTAPIHGLIGLSLKF